MLYFFSLLLSVQATVVPGPSSQGPIRLRAEYEKVNVVLLGYSKHFDTEFRQIANAVISSGVPVLGVNVIAGTHNYQSIQVQAPYLPTALIRKADPVPLVKTKKFPLWGKQTTPAAEEIYFPSPLIRTFAPVPLIKDQKILIGVPAAAPGATQLSKSLPATILHPLKDASMPLSLNGANILSNSKGAVFMTKYIYEINTNLLAEDVHKNLQNFLGATDIHMLDYPIYNHRPVPGLENIDSFVKLLNDNTVLISTHASYEFDDNAIKLFKSLGYTVLTLGGYFDENRMWRSYTRSLVINNLVLIPSYEGNKKYEEDYVLPLFQKVYKDANIVFIPGDKMIKLGAGIRTFTQTF